MLTVSQSGLTFTAIQGDADPPAQSFSVSSQGTGASQSTAQANLMPNPLAPQANWLSSSVTQGTSSSGSVNASVTVLVHQSGLPPGQYYGSIDITAPDVPNSPQSVSVMLNVLPPSSAGSDITLSATGVVLTSAAGTKTPQQQQVTVFNLTNANVNYSVATSPTAGTGWLTVSPSVGELLPGANMFTVQADFSGLTPGVQNGTVSLGFGDGTVQTIQVAAMATAAIGAGAASAFNPKLAAGGCVNGKASALMTVFDQPMDRSLVQASVGQRVRVQGADDCGGLLSHSRGDVVQVIFGNHDAPLTLHDIGGGVWEGTWVPMHSAARVSLRAIASRSNVSLSSIGTAVYAVVQSAPGGAAAQISGVVNAALGAQAIPGIVTPGGYIAIYGSNLTFGPATGVSVAPLPNHLNGTQLFLGNQPLPILYSSATQINALVPQNLVPNTTYQLKIVNGTTQSVPLLLTVENLQPGIYTADLSGSGQGIVEIAGTTMLAAPASAVSRPVQRGTEYLQIFGTGLGLVAGTNGEGAPADGAAAAPPIIYQTTAGVTATIGGVSAPVVFSGLTPTLVGLYQVNVQVPVSAPTGDAVPLVVTVTDPKTGLTVQSNTVTIAVQ
jgi:uncharacterized protein (TIGR03437 family)